MEKAFEPMVRGRGGGVGGLNAHNKVLANLRKYSPLPPSPYSPEVRSSRAWKQIILHGCRYSMTGYLNGWKDPESGPDSALPEES